MPSKVPGREIDVQIWGAVTMDDLTGHILGHAPPLVSLGILASSAAQKGLVFADLALQLVQGSDRVPFEDRDA
ncbi:hypothetical protein BGX33_003761, partial [Mortierella sp. NVP41]